jgi:hypothetical protein
MLKVLLIFIFLLYGLFCELLNFGGWRHNLSQRGEIEDLKHEFLIPGMSLKLSDFDEIALLIVNLLAGFKDVEGGPGEIEDGLDRSGGVLDVHPQVFIFELDVLSLNHETVTLAAALAEHRADCVVC